MIAGPKEQGKKSDRDIVYHGTQQSRVTLKDRQLHVEKPRLRRRNPKEGEPSEVEIPAYEAMRKDGRLADRMLEIVIAGVSTRRYEKVIPEMDRTVGVSKSQVSRETIEAGERLLEDLAGREFSGLDLLAVWIDGVQLGSYHVICAAGVDDQGKKHLLGLREGRHRERRGGQVAPRRPGRSRPGLEATPPVRDRRLAGAPQGDRPDLRRGDAGCSDAATTSFGMCWATSPKPSTTRLAPR